MSFPEEPLDLLPAEGGGYYAASIGQKLNGDQYEVVRKLGYGPRSSVWLVLRPQPAAYFAVKIYTVAASDRANRVELPVLQSLKNIDPLMRLPPFQGSFWQESEHGSHLCVVMNPLSTSIRDLRRQAESERLPVYVVQRIVRTVADSFKIFHRAKIMHGAVKAENIFLSIAMQPEFLDPVLTSESAPTTRTIGKYVTVQSQPLIHNFKWNNKRKIVADWPIDLNNFGHAQNPTYKMEANVDYLSAPETLLREGSCSPQTDIWMLGYTTFELLTGRTPFDSKGSRSDRITEMRTVLSQDEVPESWLNDSERKEYNETTSGLVASIEKSISESLHKDEAAAAASFIKDCLLLDPEKRLTATECSAHKWLAEANACSCRFC